MEAGEFNAGTVFAYTATEAAYTYGAEWLQQMRMYVMENVRFVDEFFRTKTAEDQSISSASLIPGLVGLPRFKVKPGRTG